MSARHKSRVNLLLPTEFETSFWGRFLLWLSTTGRYTILLVEVVVIIAFLSRFKLDRDLAELTETIEGNKRLVQSLQKKEQEFRSVQTKIGHVDTILRSSSQVSPVFTALVSVLPPDVKLDSIVIKGTVVTLGGQTLSNTSLGQLLAGLAADPQWRSVDLVNLGTEDGSLITFSLSLLKK